MSLLKLKTREAKILPDNCHESDDNVISTTNTTNSNYTNKSEIFEIREEIKNNQENDEFPTFLIRMLNFCREVAIFFLVMMTYAAFSKDPPKISNSPAAYRFFPENSIVTDWYRGQISKAIEHARFSDIAFVMFYAPWDADSQDARKEFQIAAEFMQDRVKFVAVNCWQPHGECRTQYNKVYKWPVLIAYLPHGRGVQYNGPISAPHIIEFLNKVCHPITHLSNESIRDFQDAYIKVKLNTSPGSMDFAVLYTAALRYLEKDPQYRITFYVTPSNTSVPSLQLFMWNETLIYPINDRPWLPDEILQWIIKHTHQITCWVLPSGTKSSALSNNMQNAASLILFTPKNPLHTNSDYYSLLQEVAQEYFICEESNIVANMLNVHLKLKRTANSLTHRQLKATCDLNSKISSQKLLSSTKTVWSNESACSQKIELKECDLIIEKSIRNFCANLKTEHCLELFPVIREPLACKHKFVDNVQLYKTSLISEIVDYKSPDSLKKMFLKNKCKHFLASEKIYPTVFAKTSTSPKNISIAGLSCKTNKTLVLLAMDSLLHYSFAERLGIDLNKQPDRSAVVILNDKMESHYILEQPINSQSLREFILNYTKNHLNRSFNSIATLSASSEPVKSENMTQVLIKELDTSTFLPTVLQNDKSVVVFYYSKQCSFCNGISYIYLTVARKLNYLKKIMFTRINGDVNILPWEYTMESYPTILFFPSNKKSESRVFPSGILMSTSNLINFLFANLEPSLKLQALWSVCIHTKFGKEQSTCYSSLIGETLNLIDDTLRNWRKSHTLQRQVLLHKLKFLRQLHLLFAHSPNNHSAILNTLNRLSLNMRYTENYIVDRTNKIHEEL